MGLIDRISSLKQVALTPNLGGVCIAPGALRAADIIVSTTASPVSAVVRLGTASVVSHAALCVGPAAVLEAIGAGVVQRSLDVALADDALAVAYRHPDMTPPIAAKIIAWASSQSGKAYTVGGATLSAVPVLCQVVGPRPAAFFCTQLIAEAYRQAGLPLSSGPSQCVTPQNVVQIAFERLVYVGHLKGNPSWLPVLAP